MLFTATLTLLSLDIGAQAFVRLEALLGWDGEGQVPVGPRVALQWVRLSLGLRSERT